MSASTRADGNQRPAAFAPTSSPAATARARRFAKEFLPKEVKCLRFLDADEIARGLSPLKPSASAIQAGRLLLEQVDQCLRRRETFALESTLSGKTYIRLFKAR